MIDDTINAARVEVLTGFRQGRFGYIIDQKHTSNGLWVKVRFLNGAEHWHARRDVRVVIAS